ncbi:uncharacterized protein LOC135225395 [Macrobrachium nipponense]|uniref:uncharacterized protein LOC135225395 n=1 Tax=Macrobrachium nipponense TaxID=159736 RepID=UPI0030C8C674
MPGNKHITETQVAQVVALYKHKVSTSENAASVGVTVRTAQHWIKKFKDGGERAQPKVGTSTGRKRKLTSRDLGFLRIAIEKNPRASSKQLKEQNRKIFSHICAKTLRKYMKGGLGYRCLAAKKKPLLTRRRIRNRLSYARRMLKNLTLQHFKGSFIVTKSHSVSPQAPSRMVYRSRSSDPYREKYVNTTTKHPIDSLMFWGCFSYHGKGALVKLPKNVTMNQYNYSELNQYNYPELLMEYLVLSMVKCNAKVFMQDGAPCHRAKTVTDLLKFCKIPFLGDCLAIAPISIPLRIVGIIKAQLRDRDTSSLKKTRERGQRHLGELSRNHPWKLSQECSRTTSAVKKKRGGRTKY